MDRIDALAVFVAVAEHRGFAAAARRLGRSPAAVTRAVGELRRGSGCVSSIAPRARSASTEAGERFLAGARRVLADLDEIERAAAGEGRAPRGELRLTAPILFGRLHVMPIVTEFLARFPDVSVALTLLDRPVDWWRRASTWRCASARWRKAQRSRPASARCVASSSPPRIIWRDTERRTRPRISVTHADSRILRHLGRRALGVRRRGRRNERCYTGPGWS